MRNGWLTLCIGWLMMLLPSSAQQRQLQNKPFIDERPWHYGFYVGLHDQGLKLTGNGWVDPDTGGQWMAENDHQNFGFSVGILGDWRLSRHLSLRLTPGLHFGSKHVTFHNLLTGREVTQNIKSSYIALPVELKVAGPRFNNYRPYVLMGATEMCDMTSTKGGYIRTSPFQTYLLVGLGCDFYMPFFKLIPELKFCFGVGDVLRHDRPDLTNAAQRVYTQSLERASANMVILTFYFE